MRSHPALILLLPAFALLAQSLPAQVSPLEHETLVSGIYSPSSLAFLPDGRMLVTRLGGIMLISTPLSERPVTMSTYMTVPNLDASGEHGLIEVVLDPDFQSNHWFYVYYSTTAQRLRVSRFTDLGNVGSAASELVIFETSTSYSECCHAGGAMAFMDDGTLVIGVGDDFHPQYAQDLTSDYGKTHRMYRDGSAPADNPFFDNTPGIRNANGVRKTVYSYGIRNPFRGSYDAPSGRFIFGMVGGNNQDLAWEDIRENGPGINHGWPYCGDSGRDPNGQCTDPQYADPLFSYPHAGQGASVAGGCIYHGTMLPPEWQGRYLYGDYTRGWIHYLDFDSAGQVTNSGAVMDTALVGGVNATSVVKIIEAPDGSIYYVSIFDDFVNYTGRIGRLFYSPNESPVCGTAAADPASGPGPTLLTELSVSATDPEGEPLTYTWVFGDASPNGNGSVVEHTYVAPGTYIAQVVVGDGTNQVTCASVPVHVGSPPTAQIVSPPNGSYFHAGDVIGIIGTGTDDAPLTEANYSWTVVFHHNEHIHPEVGASATSTFDLIVPATGHGFYDSTWYEVTLTVTDADGLVATTSINLYPEKVTFSLLSDPEGAELIVNGEPHATPYITQQAIGQELTVTLADAQPCIGGEGFAFSGWSDGLPLTHAYTVPAGGGTLTANFTPTGACGYCGQALAFDGTNDQVALDPITLTGDWTIEFWLRPDPGLTNADAILGNTTDLSLDLKNGRLHLFKFADRLTSSMPVPPSQWNHYAITRTSGVPKLYVNGVLDAAATAVAFNGALSISSMGKGVNPGFLKGAVDEMRLWNVARTQVEIAQNMDVKVDPNAAGLVAYWPFDQSPVSQIVNDITGAGHDGTRGIDGAAASDDPLFFATNGPMRLACGRSVDLQLKAMLQGPYDDGNGLMRDDLRQAGLLPLAEPYTAMGFSLTEGMGASVAPTVFQVSGPDAIVDWVVVELRDAIDPPAVVGARCALLQRDGDVVDLDGILPVTMDVDQPRYHISLRHRNHFGAMSADPLMFSGSSVVADFSSLSFACFGENARRGSASPLLFWAGNTNLDALLKYVGPDNDRDPILLNLDPGVPTSTSTGYLNTDVNLDGIIKYAGAENDRDIILLNLGGNTYTNVRIEQLP